MPGGGEALRQRSLPVPHSWSSWAGQMPAGLWDPKQVGQPSAPHSPLSEAASVSPWGAREHPSSLVPLLTKCMLDQTGSPGVVFEIFYCEPTDAALNTPSSRAVVGLYCSQRVAGFMDFPSSSVVKNLPAVQEPQEIRV